MKKLKFLTAFLVLKTILRYTAVSRVSNFAEWVDKRFIKINVSSGPP